MPQVEPDPFKYILVLLECQLPPTTPHGSLLRSLHNIFSSESWESKNIKMKSRVANVVGNQMLKLSSECHAALIRECPVVVSIFTLNDDQGESAWFVYDHSSNDSHPPMNKHICTKLAFSESLGWLNLLECMLNARKIPDFISQIPEKQKLKVECWLSEKRLSVAESSHISIFSFLYAFLRASLTISLSYLRRKLAKLNFSPLTVPAVFVPLRWQSSRICQLDDIGGKSSPM